MNETTSEVSHNLFKNPLASVTGSQQVKDFQFYFTKLLELT